MTELSKYKDCPKCGKPVRVDAALCAFCWTEFRDAPYSPYSSTSPEASAAPAPLNGSTDRESAGEATKNATPRAHAVMKRYRDAYLVANVVVTTGETIKAVGIGLAAVLAFIGFVAASNAGILALLACVVPAVLIGLVSWLSGVLLNSQGQLLLASLDNVVNSSPFLAEDEKAEVMSLP